MSKHDIPFRQIPEQFRRETFSREKYREGWADAQSGKEPMADDDLELIAVTQGYIAAEAYEAGFKRGSPVKIKISGGFTDRLAELGDELDDES